MIYTFGEFELDTRLFELRAAGTRRAVEPQVFDVLRYLVENRERVVAREELLEKLWPGRYVSETTLTSRLMAARKAVGDDARKQLWIRTVHGRGYRFAGTATEKIDVATLTSGPVSGVHLVEVSAPQPEAPVAPGFVGRGSELRSLCEHFTLAATGRRQVVFITGEAGAGKTTLVDAFVASLPEGTRVATGHCLEHRGTGEAYLPVLEAIERLARSSGGTPVAEVLRSVAPTWLAQMPVLARAVDAPAADPNGDRMLREMAAAAEAIAADAPLVLVLEDLHWSDFSTLDLLLTIARRRDAARLMIVGTYRPADVKAAQHPLYSVAQDLLIRGHCRQIALPLLREEELAQYIETRFPGAGFVGTLGPLLHQRTAGNPLFARAMVDSWIARGFLHEDGAWSLTVDPDVLLESVPETLSVLIEQHIAQLPGEQQELLEAASAAGREFSSAAIAAAVASGEDAVERCCATMAREGRFLRAAGTEVWSDGTIAERFSFAHDLYVDVLYARLPAGRRARVHEAIGRRLEEAWRGKEREHAAELALHFARGRDSVRALAHGKTAAEVALARGARHEAIEHLETALQTLASLPAGADHRTDELWIRRVLAESIVATRGWGETPAEGHFLRARDLARTLGDLKQLSAVLHGLGTMYEFRAEYARTEAITNERLEVDSDRSPEIRLEAHELLLCSLMHQARFREAIVHADEASAATEEIRGRGEETPAIGIQSHGWASVSLFFLGDCAAAAREAAALRELVTTTPDELARGIGLVQSSFVHFHRREPELARRFADEAMSVAFEYRFPFLAGAGRVVRGWCAAHQGEAVDGALADMRAGIRTCRSIGALLDIPLFFAMVTEVCLHASREEEARAAIGEALALVDGARPYFYKPEIFRLRGVVAEQCDGDRDEAKSWYCRALALAREQESTLLALRAATSLAAIDASAGEDLDAAIIAMGDRLDTADLTNARQLREAMGA